VISDEVARLAAGVDGVADAVQRDLFRVALIHTLKIAGRRDFTAPSVIEAFRRRVAQVATAAAALPREGPRPSFHIRGADTLPVDDSAARLVVTSPPYKDLDVEYGLLQIQRPAAGRSKRSLAVWALLGVPPVAKTVLCGGRGDAYDERIRPAMAEIRRVLADGCPAFFWIGFKTGGDKEGFLAALAAAGLKPVHLVAVGLSRDRVASSRSTHHGRDTGMLAKDYLIVCE
jgi:hypothetical protein